MAVIMGCADLISSACETSYNLWCGVWGVICEGGGKSVVIMQCCVYGVRSVV